MQSGHSELSVTVDFNLLRICVVRVVVRVRAHIQSRVRNFQIYNAGMMTSARTTGYSPDIGWRVVWQRLSLNYRYKDIAMRLQIGVGTAHRIFKKFELTGDTELLHSIDLLG